MTFSVATCILVALISLVLYDWLIVQTNPPVLNVESEGAVRAMQGQYYQPFRNYQSWRRHRPIGSGGC